MEISLDRYATLKERLDGAEVEWLETVSNDLRLQCKRMVAAIKTEQELAGQNVLSAGFLYLVHDVIDELRDDEGIIDDFVNELKGLSR
jgi:hypothetical protein